MDGISEETMELPDDHRGLGPMIHEFHRSIQERRTPSMSGTDGIDDLVMVLKAYESMELGMPLPLA